jgi:hypothetical protein
LAALAAYAATLVIGGLVVYDGEIPSAFTSLFFVPIIFVAYRYSLPVSLGVAAIASVFSSPELSMA